MTSHEADDLYILGP